MKAWTSRRRNVCLLCALTLLVLAVPAVIDAQSKKPKQTKKQLESLYAKKLGLEFMNKVAWERSLKKAKERSYEANKPIYAYFTRSYSY